MVAKNKIVQSQQLAKTITQAKAVYLLDYQGLDASTLNELRAKVKEVGGQLKVYKNAIIFWGLCQAGFEPNQPIVGPTAILFAFEDEVAPLKPVAQLAKEREKEIFKLGLLAGCWLESGEVRRLSTLPGRDELIAKLVTGLQAPLFRFFVVSRYQLWRLMAILAALKEKKGGEG